MSLVIRENFESLEVVGTNPPLTSFIDYGPLFPLKRSDQDLIIIGDLVTFNGQNLLTFDTQQITTIAQ